MKKSLLFILFAFSAISGLKSSEKVRDRIKFDYDWKFIQNDIPDAYNPETNDSKWRMLNLPHDWSIEGEFDKNAVTTGYGGFLPTGIGWYRKYFDIKQLDNSRKYLIEFDGVYMNSEVWLNGSYLGKHVYGYTGFQYDLTPFLKKGKNVIAVKVDNSVQPNSRWYSGSGIYRHVWLNITDKIHVAQWGTYITTPEVDSTMAVVKIKTTIENANKVSKNITLRSIVKNATGNVVSQTELPLMLNSTLQTIATQTLKVTQPELWSVEIPALYTLESVIMDGKKQLDSYSSTFGIRKIEYNANKGFFLNGKHLKMNGVCLHHDAGCLGAAVPDQAWIRRFKLLKEMGCNAIRTAHNPASPEFLDLCDRMGFLVMAEAFDEWEYPKEQIKYGYHHYFAENWKSDLISMIRRDRNHPSIVIWSAGNEVPDQTYDNGITNMRNMIEVFHSEDPTRPVTQANDRIAADKIAAKLPFLELQDIVGYNYVDRWHERRELYYSVDKMNHPQWKMIGTENDAPSSTRSVYKIPDKNNPVQHINYVYEYPRVEQLWKFTAMHDYVAGDFMWTGIDFNGESRWPDRISTSGMLDVCGFKKDGFFFYQSQWTEKPMVHLLPHWNWAGHEGQIIPVIAFTNCDSAELFLNGKPYGLKTKAFPQQGNSMEWYKHAKPLVRQSTSELHFAWDVPYEPGTVKIVARKEGRTAIQELKTTGVPVTIRLKSDRTAIIADAQDIVNIEVEILDINGNVVPTADNPIEFSIEGEGEIIGTDNGNPKDMTMMQSKQRKAFNGLALAVIRSTLSSGKVKLIAESSGLVGADVLISTLK